MRLFKYFMYLALASAVLACDPQTQYKKEYDQCCKKCGPGTRMSESELSCLDPVCRPCSEDEYQMGYTAKTRCDLQPYCDPNKHFVHDGPVTKDKQTSCKCDHGYHCASQICITCVAHSTCGAGQRVAVKGNNVQDTVCQDCPLSTFSTRGPGGDMECHNWTVCEHGLETLGTTTSDTICVKGPNYRVHYILIPVTLVGLLLTLLGLYGHRFRGCGKKKHFGKLGTDETHTVCTDVQIPIQENGVPATPEESDEQLINFGSPAVSNGRATNTLSESGRPVVQERGKGPVVPQQVSQPYNA